MYVVIRKFNNMRAVDEAARRAEAGIGPLLRQAPGFRAYYVCDGGHGIGFSVSLFESRAAAATEASAKALLWIKENLADLYEGQPEVTSGEVLASVTVSPP
jgi:hypothetical protein